MHIGRAKITFLLFLSVTVGLFSGYQLANLSRPMTVSSYESSFLSIGPYQNQTHDCYYHNPMTCKAEFQGKEVRFHVGSLDDSYDTTGVGLTTANGFLDLNLPKNRSFEVELVIDGLGGSGIVTTTEGSPTCITNIRMV